MFNNEIRLIGWLEITAIQQEQDSDGQWIPVLQGYIHTDKAYFGGRHPVLMKGKPASIVIEAAQQVNNVVQVFIIGRLRSPTSEDGRSYVIVHYVRILGEGAEYLMPEQNMQQILGSRIDQYEQDIIKFLRERGNGSTKE